MLVIVLISCEVQAYLRQLVEVGLLCGDSSCQGRTSARSACP
jgi:hypothetical protein